MEYMLKRHGRNHLDVNKVADAAINRVCKCNSWKNKATEASIEYSKQGSMESEDNVHTPKQDDVNRLPKFVGDQTTKRDHLFVLRAFLQGNEWKVRHRQHNDEAAKDGNETGDACVVRPQE